MKKIGIIAPMEEEFRLIRSSFRHFENQRVGLKDFIVCTDDSVEIYLVQSSIGKVAAASTATTLINVFNVDSIILIGVAGGMHNQINIGDIVIGDEFYQHDYDLKGLLGFNRFEVHQVNEASIKADSQLVRKLKQASEEIINSHHKKHLDYFFKTDTSPKLYIGKLAAGDQFINSHAEREDLISSIPELLAVEMESAAIAQVCKEYDVSFSAIKVISDAANHLAIDDFTKFIEDVAAITTCEVVNSFMRHASR